MFDRVLDTPLKVASLDPAQIAVFFFFWTIYYNLISIANQGFTVVPCVVEIGHFRKNGRPEILFPRKSKSSKECFAFFISLFFSFEY